MLQTFKSKTIGKKTVDSDVILLTLQLIDPNQIEFVPGQYVLLNIPKEDNSIAFKHFSIASSPDRRDKIDLVVKLIHRGIASSYVEKLEIGEEVVFSGPAGRFALHENERDKIFIATGTGIAPIKSMILSEFKIQNSPLRSSSFEEQAKFKIQLFWGLKHYKDTYFIKEFVKLADEHPHFKFYICISRDKNLGEVNAEYKKHFLLGRVTEGLKERISNIDYYICGGRDIVESLRQHLYDIGVPKEQVFFEKF